MKGLFFLNVRTSLYWLGGLIAASLLIGVLVSLHLIARSDITIEYGSASLAVQQSLISLRDGYQAWFPKWFRDGSWLVYTSGILILIPLSLLLESRFPSNPKQALISRGLLHDSIWFLFNTVVFKLTIYLVFGAVLYQFYRNHLGFLTVDAVKSWPIAAQVCLGFLLGDFMGWFSHLVRHKIGFLWSFHSVHHSQEEMNVFTDDRTHPMDALARLCITFIPFYMFHVSLPLATAFLAVLYSTHGRLVHVNFRANLGLLGYLIVSPQFHRVHHSKNPADHDCNFGGVLSVWDYIFGTASANKETYPSTGISDAFFPREQRCTSSFDYIAIWLRQLIYPFVQVFYGWKLLIPRPLRRRP